MVASSPGGKSPPLRGWSQTSTGSSPLLLSVTSPETDCPAATTGGRMGWPSRLLPTDARRPDMIRMTVVKRITSEVKKTVQERLLRGAAAPFPPGAPAQEPPAKGVRGESAV